MSHLQRYLELTAALDAHRRWYESAALHRYAALALLDAHGPAPTLAAATAARAAEIRDHAGWFDGLRSGARHALAALLVRDEIGTAAFHDDVARARSALRALGMRRGGEAEAAATLLLRVASGRPPTERDFVRLRDAHAAMRENHYWFTGIDDYPACALFAAVDAPLAATMRRVEAIYARLVAAGAGRGSHTQLTSHLLHFAPGDDDAVTARFLALRDRFEAEGVSIWRADHDELALLAALDRPARGIVDAVLHHRDGVRRLRPRPGPVESFSLAAGIVASELGGAPLRSLRDLQLVAQVHRLVVESRRAAAAAASA